MLARRKSVEGHILSVILSIGFLRLCVQARRDHSGLLLRGDVEMGVDVRRRAEGRVPQPDLDLLHRHAVCQQQTSCGMPL